MTLVIMPRKQKEQLTKTARLLSSLLREGDTIKYIFYDLRYKENKLRKRPSFGEIIAKLDDTRLLVKPCRPEKKHLEVVHVNQVIGIWKRKRDVE